MTRILTTTALMAISFATVPAAAQDVAQLAAGAGLSRAEAQHLTLTEIAVMKFNRGADSDGRQALVARADARSSSTPPVTRS